MRRIIERVVTVVTTTTWKISWEPDSSQPDHSVDSIFNALPSPDALPETVYDTRASAKVVETKEVDLPEKRKND